MKELNLKPHFFEMILQEPVLQAKLAKFFDSEDEKYIEVLAERQNEFLSIPGLRKIIADSYNQSIPEHLKITPIQTLNNVYVPEFNKSFDLIG